MVHQKGGLDRRPRALEERTKHAYDDGPSAERSKRVSGPLGAFRQLLNDIAVVPLATDLSGAVARAEALAKGGNASSKEVYVFSDLQDSGWEEAPDGPGGSDVSFTFVQVKPRKKDSASARGAVLYVSTVTPIFASSPLRSAFP